MFTGRGAASPGHAQAKEGAGDGRVVVEDADVKAGRVDVWSDANAHVQRAVLIEVNLSHTHTIVTVML